MALPWLESVAAAAAPAAASVGVPKRLAFAYVPNGIHLADWFPTKEGALGTLPDILKPLEAHKQYINMFGGLTLDKAAANGDGGGDHARAMSSFLTGRQARKTHGADIRAGISADQHVAGVIGEHTRFPSLELGVERGGQAGNCDSGYSCAYSSNLSWRSENTPNAKETDPKAVFERLFGSTDSKEGNSARNKRDAYNQSVLDYILEDAKQLDKTLGSGDKRKVEEYLTSVREVETRIQRMVKEQAQPRPKIDTSGLTLPKATPQEFVDHVRIMSDLMVLAFQTDTTRIVTFPFANDGSNRPYKKIDVPEGHHDLSHHGKSVEKQAKLKKINTHHVEQLAYLLDKLRAVKEANGTNLLDNTLMVYGSGIGDGDRHNHDDLPILTLGKGGGTLEAGRHLKFAKETPLMNLYLAMFDRIGAPLSQFGDSTGKLKL